MSLWSVLRFLLDRLAVLTLALSLAGLAAAATQPPAEAPGAGNVRLRVPAADR